MLSVHSGLLKRAEQLKVRPLRENVNTFDTNCLQDYLVDKGETVFLYSEIPAGMNYRAAVSEYVFIKSIIPMSANLCIL